MSASDAEVLDPCLEISPIKHPSARPLFNGSSLAIWRLLSRRMWLLWSGRASAGTRFKAVRWRVDDARHGRKPANLLVGRLESPAISGLELSYQRAGELGREY